MRKVLAAGAAVALLFAAAPLTAVQADTRVASKPQPDFPRKKLNKQMPRFATQPKVMKNGTRYAVEAKVTLTPWRTKNRNVQALPDKAKVSLDVSKKEVLARTVGLTKKSRKQGLMWSGKIGPKVVKNTDTYTISLPVPKKVGRSLASQPPKQQRQRLRMTVEHMKDVSPDVKAREGTQVAQSGTSASTPKRAASLSGNGESTSTYGYLWNYTPFDLNVSAQGVNCISQFQWSGSLSENGAWYSQEVQIYTSGSAMANDYSTADTLSSDAITALKSSAEQAGQNAASAGSALFTPSGAVSAAVGWAVGFTEDFIKDIVDNSCSSQPSLFTTSAAVDGVGGVAPADEGLYGVNVSGDYWKPSQVTFPAEFDINEMNGAQTSTLWHYNGGSPQPSGPGSFNWAGGLMTMASNAGGNAVNPAGFQVSHYFESDAANPTGFGPAPTVWPLDSANANSAGLTAQWDSGNMLLNCSPGQWDLYNPWGETLALTPGALSPPNNEASSGNQMYMQVSYNGTDAEGAAVYNESFTGVEPVTTFDSGTQTFTIDSSSLQGITVDEWQCSIGASIQVQNWAVPSAWPTVYMGSTPNGAWWNAPNVIVTAPYVAP